MRVRSFVLVLMLLLLIAAFAASTPSAAAGADESATAWVLPFSDNVTDITRNSTRVRVEYSVATCGIGRASDYLQRVKVRRRKRTIDITVFVGKPQVSPNTPCLAVAAVGRTRVHLRGRLGRRSLRDASADPPRVVVKRRPARH